MNLSDEAARSQGFFHEHPAILMIIDLGGGVLDVNEAGRRALGPGVAPGVSLASCVHPGERGEFEAGWARLESESEPAVSMTLRLRAQDGAYATFAARARRGAGKPWVYVQMSPDLSASARGEGRAAPEAPGDAPPLSGSPASIVQQRALVMQTMVEHLEMVVWAIDAHGNYTVQEGKALAALGLKPGDDVGKNMFERYGWDTSVGARRALSGEQVHEIVELGDVYWESWLGPVRDASGEVTGAVGISVNVTEAQRARLHLEEQRRLIERQAEVIRNLETPVIQVWDRVLTLPMVGVVDSQRAARVMDDLLAAVARQRARFVILDLTGVEVVDSATAGHLMSMVRALRLLGAEGIITGIRPTVAQTVVALGLDLAGITTMANLREGLSLAIQRMNDELSEEAAPGYG